MSITGTSVSGNLIWYQSVHITVVQSEPLCTCDNRHSPKSSASNGSWERSQHWNQLQPICNNWKYNKGNLKVDLEHTTYICNSKLLLQLKTPLKEIIKTWTDWVKSIMKKSHNLLPKEKKSICLQSLWKRRLQQPDCETRWGRSPGRCGCPLQPLRKDFQVKKCSQSTPTTASHT